MNWRTIKVWMPDFQHPCNSSTAWVQKPGDEEFKQWDGFAGYSCYLYNNYEMRGEAVKQIYANKAITVLWQAVRKSTDEGSSSSGGSSGGGSEWTPPANKKPLETKEISKK